VCVPLVDQCCYADQEDGSGDHLGRAGKRRHK
jgi:hypothetical protein